MKWRVAGENHPRTKGMSFSNYITTDSTNNNEQYFSLLSNLTSRVNRHVYSEGKCASRKNKMTGIRNFRTDAMKKLLTLLLQGQVYH